MGSFNFPRLTFGMKIIYGIAAAVVIATIVTVVAINSNMKAGTTIKVQSVKGDVRIEMANGKTKPAKNGLRFKSGDSVLTGADGICTVALDDTKIITLNNNSKAEFKKQDKEYGVNLSKGGAFFEVTSPLAGDEKLDIKALMLTANIKGTSGYIYFNEDGTEAITVTDGKVVLTAVNPKTSERIYGEVSGGQRYVVTTAEKNGLDVLSYEITDLTVNDLEDFALTMINQTDRLLTKVCEFTGWDKQSVKELYNLNTFGNIEGSSEETEATVSSEDSETEPGESETEATEATKSETGTTKPKATNTPKPKDEKDKDKDSKATNTPKPTNTPTPKATATPSPVPTTATAEPTAATTPATEPTTPAATTPSPEPTATNTPTPTPTNTNTPTPKPNTPTPKPAETQPPAGGGEE